MFRMPLTVTAWPYSPDPRLPSFSLRGYAFGQVPPWKFLATTTGATDPWTDLNDPGVLLTQKSDVGDITVYDEPTGRYLIEKTGFEFVQSGPDHTVKFVLIAQDQPNGDYEGTDFQVFPDAIRIWTVGMSPIGQPSGLIPNPVIITPRKWDFEL